jgi:hypothetical protein
LGLSISGAGGRAEEEGLSRVAWASDAVAVGGLTFSTMGTLDPGAPGAPKAATGEATDVPPAAPAAVAARVRCATVLLCSGRLATTTVDAEAVFSALLAPDGAEAIVDEPPAARVAPTAADRATAPLDPAGTGAGRCGPSPICVLAPTRAAGKEAEGEALFA